METTDPDREAAEVGGPGAAVPEEGGHRLELVREERHVIIMGVVVAGSGEDGVLVAAEEEIALVVGHHGEAEGRFG